MVPSNSESLRITCKPGNEPEGVMDGRCQVNSLVVRRSAPSSLRMIIRSDCRGRARVLDNN